MNEATIQLRDKGVITLPMSLRRKYSLRTGDVFGEGVLMISPKSSRVAALGDKVADILRAEGVSVEELLEGLDEERERYYREHFERTRLAAEGYRLYAGEASEFTAASAGAVAEALRHPQVPAPRRHRLQRSHHARR